jgi:hypothetical protein
MPHRSTIIQITPLKWHIPESDGVQCYTWCKALARHSTTPSTKSKIAQYTEYYRAHKPKQWLFEGQFPVATQLCYPSAGIDFGLFRNFRDTKAARPPKSTPMSAKKVCSKINYPAAELQGMNSFSSGSFSK